MNGTLIHAVSQFEIPRPILRSSNHDGACC
jgi:hypothetical protein